MQVLTHLCTAPAAAQPAKAAAAPTGTGTAAAAVLQDLVWNGLVLKEKTHTSRNKRLESSMPLRNSSTSMLSSISESTISSIYKLSGGWKKKAIIKEQVDKGLNHYLFPFYTTQGDLN